MRYMIIVRATAASESGQPPPDELVQAMADYHEELARAGVLLEGNGLKASARGWRVLYGPQLGADTPCLVVDGPFAETQELIAGYTLIQVRSRAEALEWSRRFPPPFGPGNDCAIEVRELFELDDFHPGEGVDRFRALDAARG